VSYTLPPNLVLLIPSKTTINYSGLADAIKNVNTTNTVALCRRHAAQPGSIARLAVRVTTIGNVTVQTPAPIVVNVDTLQSKELPVQVVARALGLVP